MKTMADLLIVNSFTTFGTDVTSRTSFPALIANEITVPDAIDQLYTCNELVQVQYISD